MCRWPVCDPGAIEPQFYAELLQRLGLSDVDPKQQFDVRQWPALKARVAQVIRTRTRAQWCESLEGTDVCFAPVLGLAEAADHPHNAARGLFVDVPVDGQLQRQPAPAPRLSRTPARAPSQGTRCGEQTDQILAELGLDPVRVAELRSSGVCA